MTHPLVTHEMVEKAAKAAHPDWHVTGFGKDEVIRPALEAVADDLIEVVEAKLSGSTFASSEAATVNNCLALIRSLKSKL